MRLRRPRGAENAHLQHIPVRRKNLQRIAQFLKTLIDELDIPPIGLIAQQLQCVGDNFADHVAIGHARQRIEQFIARMMRLTPHTPEAVANKLLKVIEHRSPPLRVAGTIDAHLFGLFRRLFPRYFYHLILYYSLPGIRHWGDLDDSTK